MIRLRVRPGPAHYQVRVFVGPDADQLALSGILQLRRGGEYADFIIAITKGDMEVMTDAVPQEGAPTR